MVVFYFGQLTYHYLAFGSDGSSSVVHSDECLHFVFYSTLGMVVSGFVLNQEGRTEKEAG